MLFTFPICKKIEKGDFFCRLPLIVCYPNGGLGLPGIIFSYKDDSLDWIDLKGGSRINHSIHRRKELLKKRSP